LLSGTAHGVASSAVVELVFDVFIGALIVVTNDPLNLRHPKPEAFFF
jgi:hypothetical protein